MKRKAILYTIYCLVVISVLAGFLIYKATFNDEEVAFKAESITLNSPHEITVSTNKEIQLLDGFISTEPASAIDLLQYEITTSSTTSVDNFNFDFSKKTFVAKHTGYYYIKFYVPKNNYSNLHQTLKIHAVSYSEDFTFLTNKIVVGESADFGSIFEQNKVFNFSVAVSNNNLTFAKNRFYANHTGTTKVYITINLNYISYTNEYEIHIEEQDFDDQQKDPDSENNDNPGNENDNENKGDQSGEKEENSGGAENPGNEGSGNKPDENLPETGGSEKPEEPDKTPEKETYNIVILSGYLNEEYNTYVVNFFVENGNKEHITQKITATVNNSTVAEIEYCDAPLIYIKILKSGKFTLTISLSSNPNISKSIEIEVVVK